MLQTSPEPGNVTANAAGYSVVVFALGYLAKLASVLEPVAAMVNG
jgi:hypothetical protein